jgi:hypothetical protein
MFSKNLGAEGAIQILIRDNLSCERSEQDPFNPSDPRSVFSSRPFVALFPPGHPR